MSTNKDRRRTYAGGVDLAGKYLLISTPGLYALSDDPNSFTTKSNSSLASICSGTNTLIQWHGVHTNHDKFYQFGDKLLLYDGLYTCDLAALAEGSTTSGFTYNNSKLSISETANFGSVGISNDIAFMRSYQSSGSYKYYYTTDGSTMTECSSIPGDTLIKFNGYYIALGSSLDLYTNKTNLINDTAASSLSFTDYLDNAPFAMLADDNYIYLINCEDDASLHTFGRKVKLSGTQLSYDAAFYPSKSGDLGTSSIEDTSWDFLWYYPGDMRDMHRTYEEGYSKSTVIFNDTQTNSDYVGECLSHKVTCTVSDGSVTIDGMKNMNQYAYDDGAHASLCHPYCPDAPLWQIVGDKFYVGTNGSTSVTAEEGFMGSVSFTTNISMDTKFVDGADLCGFTDSHAFVIKLE